jgi:hypothetical protein
MLWNNLIIWWKNLIIKIDHFFSECDINLIFATLNNLPFDNSALILYASKRKRDEEDDSNDEPDSKRIRTEEDLEPKESIGEEYFSDALEGGLFNEQNPESVAEENPQPVAEENSERVAEENSESVAEENHESVAEDISVNASNIDGSYLDDFTDKSESITSIQRDQMQALDRSDQASEACEGIIRNIDILLRAWRGNPRAEGRIMQLYPSFFDENSGNGRRALKDILRDIIEYEYGEWEHYDDLKEILSNDIQEMRIIEDEVEYEHLSNVEAHRDFAERIEESSRIVDMSSNYSSFTGEYSHNLNQDSFFSFNDVSDLPYDPNVIDVVIQTATWVLNYL